MVVVFGGYVCLPVAQAAKRMDIPVVIHEQNSVMGMANDFISKDATAVCLTYKAAGHGVKDQSKVLVTGNPVRSSVLKATREEGRDYLGIPQDATMLLVFGGSFGRAPHQYGPCCHEGSASGNGQCIRGAHHRPERA